MELSARVRESLRNFSPDVRKVRLTNTSTVGRLSPDESLTPPVPVSSLLWVSLRSSLALSCVTEEVLTSSMELGGQLVQGVTLFSSSGRSHLRRS